MEHAIGSNFVSILEDRLAPVGRKSVRLWYDGLVVSKVHAEHNWWGLKRRGQAYLHHDIAQLSLHVALGAREPLPQIISHASLLEQVRAGLLGSPYLHNAVDVLHSAADEGGAQNALGNLGRLLLAGLRLQVEQRQIYVSLQVWAEPWLEVCLLRCFGRSTSLSRFTTHKSAPKMVGQSLTGLALPIDAREGDKGATQDQHVCEGEDESPPIQREHDGALYVLWLVIARSWPSRVYEKETKEVMKSNYRSRKEMLVVSGGWWVGKEWEY